MWKPVIGSITPQGTGRHMVQLEYGIASIVRELFMHGRNDKLRRSDACRKVARGDTRDERTGYIAARYAAATWFGVAATCLVAWLLVAFISRMAFGVGGFDNEGVQVAIRILTGLIICSMILVGIIVAKSPGRYVVNGKSSYVARKFGPYPIDFWIGVLIGVVAAAAL